MNSKKPLYKRKKFWKWTGITLLALFVIGTISDMTGYSDKMEAEKAAEQAEREAQKADEALKRELVKSAEKAEKAAAKEAKVKAEQVATKAEANFEGLSQDEAVKLAVKEAMNDGSYVEHYIEEDTLWLTLNLGDNLTANMMRKGGLMDALALAELFEEHSILGDIPELDITFETELTDAYGNSSPGTVLEVGFTAETLAKINYDNVLHENVPTIADYYWQHPLFNK